MLRWRLILGTLIVAVFAELCFLDRDGKWPWLLPAAMIVTALATDEVLTLAALADLRPLRWTVFGGNLLIVSSISLDVLQSYWLNGRLSGLEMFPGNYTTTTLVALVAGVLLVCFGEMCRYEKPGGNIANVAAGIFTLVYVGCTLSFAVQLRYLWGVGALASWIIVVKMGDIGAYTVGRLIGRHKMAPLLSPGKTIEGALGALAFSCLGSWLTFRWLVPVCTPERFGGGPWWGWLAFGLLVGAAGTFGDLFESLLKRDVGRKDSSTWLPGFGGVLDIIDSLLLSAPVAWFCWASGLVGR